MKDEHQVHYNVGVLTATLRLLLMYNYVDQDGKGMIERTLKDVENKMSDD